VVFVLTDVVVELLMPTSGRGHDSLRVIINEMKSSSYWSRNS
jgi:hypothetical protein